MARSRVAKSGDHFSGMFMLLAGIVMGLLFVVHTAAAAGYRKALVLSPNNARLHWCHAIAIRYAGGARADVVAELRTAAENAPASDAPLMAEIVNSLTFNELYFDQPGRYEMNIKDGLGFVKLLPVEYPGSISVYLACAHGQKARRNRLENAPDAAFRELRDSALEAVQAGKDHLAVFREDAEFRRELHLAEAA